MNTPKSLSPEPTPLMMLTPAKTEDDPRSSRQLQLAPASRFGLPDGWFVEEKPRRSSHTVDKYYFELHTGLKFRSLAAVHRYLTDGKVDIRTRVEKAGTQRTMKPFRRSSSFTLPDGWEIEEKPRKNTNSSHSDKYYIEPGTGKRFRSLVSVERYLTEEYEDTPLLALMPANKTILSSGSGSQKTKVKSLEFPNQPPLLNEHYTSTLDAMELNTCLTPVKHPSSPEKIISGEASTPTELTNGRVGSPPLLNECYTSTLDAMELNTYLTPAKHPSSPKKIICEETICGETSRPSELTNGRVGSPPRKVKWVLAGPGGNMWNPFMDDSKVADSVKQKWSEIFKSSICDENAKARRS